MASDSGKMLKSANPSTIQNKFMVGYQGWFTCAGDGEPIDPGHHGWLHWFNYPIPDGGRPNTDVWPDVSSCSPSELFPAPGLKTITGEQTFLFSSRNAKTVQRHFHWMAEHGVDGAFLQRFAGQCDGDSGIRRLRDEVGERVREAAEREGRVFAIMYDVSGVPADRIQRILESDWVHLVHELGVLDSPNYLREKGKPVLALWGFGFDGRGHEPGLVRAITQFFRNSTPGGVYIMGGTPTHWSTGVGDADRNPDFPQMWLNEFDAISPWTVGRFSTEQEADNFAKTKMKDDWELIKSRNQGDSTRKVDYIPVIFPGFSGYNLSEGKWGFNGFKRQGGRFLWKQIYNAHQLGIHTVYGAMWDEYDEGTAFMPIVEHKRNLPVSDKYQFLALDEDGFDIPSDWYMRICGFAAEGLRNERRIHETFPVKELQDYWSSRPKYEDVNLKSKEFRSGSLLSNKDEDEDPGGGSGGQTYQEWLALQREENEEVPPPPYTLEVDEPIPPQTVTNANIRTSTAVATTAEVPVQNSPAVANVQPLVSSSQIAARPAVNINTYPASHAASSSQAVPSSNIPTTAPPAVNLNTYPASQAASSSQSGPTATPPAVNLNTYPTSAAPVSRQEAYSQVSAQSSQSSYPPAQGHSSGGVHYHPQSVAPPSQRYSPQLYPPPGVSQHSHSHLSSQSHPPQQPLQPYPSDVSQYPQSHNPINLNSSHAVSGQPVQSYPPQTGQQQHQPYQAQNFQPCPPTSSQAPVRGQQPQPYPPGGPSYQGYPTSSTGHSQGYPSSGSPSQGYASPVAQSYLTSGGPVHQGYPPVDNNTCQIHNQPQDSVNALANEFRRQSISNPSGVSSDGRLPPPPLHPSRRPSSASLKPSSPSGVLPPPPLHPERPNRPPSSLKPSSPSNFPIRTQSQTGHHQAAVTPPASSSPGQVTSATTTSTNRPRWPPVEWDSDTPPVPQISGHRPSTHGHVGATLPRPQTVGALSSNSVGGSSLRPTSSMSARPSRPDSNTPAAAYSSKPTYRQDLSDNNVNPISFPTGPAKYEQYVSFPSGPLYNSSYTSSSYPDQQDAIGYGTWPASGHASQPPVTFPVSAAAYGAPPGSSYGSGIESQYPGRPIFPSTTSSGSASGGERLNFPEGPVGSYFDAPSSSSYPAPSSSTSGPPMQSPGQQSSSKQSGALGIALSAVDKVVGRRARDEIESQVDNIAQSKLFNKFKK